MSLPGQSNPWMLIKHAACKSNEEDFFSLLRETGRFGSDIQGQGAIHYCAIYGHVAWIKRLAEMGLGVDQADAAGNLPLDLAIRMGQVESAIGLIGLGSPVASYGYTGQQPIHAASSSAAMFPVLEEILDVGCRVDARDRHGYRTALHFACENDCLDAVVLLLENNADPWARSGNGQIPRDLAPSNTPSFDYISAVCTQGIMEGKCHPSQNKATPNPRL